MDEGPPKHLRHVLWLLPLLCVLAGWLDGREVDASVASAERRAVRRALAKRLQLPETPYRYAGVPLPKHVDERSLRFWDNTPRRNPMTDAGATLGRVLFYDPLLSATGTVSCASCHEQSRAFADRRRRSPGVHGRRGPRNAMSLVNARYHPQDRFFWDERAGSLEEQVLKPIADRSEMALPLEQLAGRVRQRPEYAQLFAEAFGDESVSNERVAAALAQFVRALVSFRSRYDDGLARVETVDAPFPNFTKQENEGKALFFGGRGSGRCASCHTAGGRRGRRADDKPALFLGRFASNNGLDKALDAKDGGIGAVTGEAEDLGSFKSPSLRNVALTGPYMHDGRLKTLADVIEHYARGVQDHPNLDRRLRGRGAGGRRLNLSSSQRKALVAFLETLTDRAFTRDPRFADPFR